MLKGKISQKTAKDFFSKLSLGGKIVWMLAIFGIILVIYRYAAGLGAATNLSDGYPWGLWIGFDILAGIALAAGGFVMAGTVHLFGGHKYHALSRPAILTALLGYLLFIFGLFFDLGRPWNLWRAIYSWNHASPMFEVAWCVMLYTTVLILEFLPVVFERFKLNKLLELWRTFVPWIIIFMLGMFTLAMSYSLAWALVMVIILLVWEISMRAGWMPRDKQMPILLIMAGVMFSTMHQSSLGSIFLLAPTKLHILWYTPIIPLLFLLSAIMAAPAMVTFEALMSEKILKHKARFDLLSDLAGWMPYLLGFYLLIKIADLLGRNAALQTFTMSPQTISWWLEITIGVILPLILFLSPEIIKTRGGLLWASTLVIVGLVWNRINVAIVGVIVEKWETYYPYWIELFITIGVVAIGLIVFKWAVENLPIYEHDKLSNV
ncbi:MAG: Ni/Fe-hydrogenase cytochrome b subunit [Ignavibacteria bacterium CG_4_9_14_3_um_filter_36_18]|nr:Ni/Fe-hydrogenase cytochrome b subunit [Ignavibacteria bacterium]PJB01955.1 MAG: Ni/Fe-hydrogenase cytochrome b subunit [Ignavibacteria bacterium CG_4_9_14_3_um_filter_36_18]